MYAPYHDFLLLPEGEAGKLIYQEFWSRSNEQPNYRAFLLQHHGIRVPDGLMGYLWDTLQWVPTEHPFEETGKWAKPWQGYGLDSHGHTAIRKRGAPVFRRLCESWAALFALAPRTFTLRGSWECDEQRYKKLTGYRNEVVPILNRLAHHAERASTGEFFVLHVGI
jgi:hypothetical protein